MEFTKKVYSTVIVLMLLCLSPLTAQAQTNTVKGTVNGSDGPVIGATVKVKGSSTGVVTDYDGNYTIKVKPGDVLTFSYLEKNGHTYLHPYRCKQFYRMYELTSLCSCGVFLLIEWIVLKGSGCPFFISHPACYICITKAVLNVS